MFQPGQKGACGRKCLLNSWEHLVTSLHIIDERLRIKLNCDLLERSTVKGNRGAHAIVGKPVILHENVRLVCGDKGPAGFQFTANAPGR